jgi:hypothetical protein
MAIRGERHVELRIGQDEVRVAAELPAITDDPAVAVTVLRIVADELSFQRLGRHSSGRTRTSKERLLRLLQTSDRLVPADRREIIEELGRRLARFEAVKQRLEGHARADEHRCPTHDFPVALNDRFSVAHRMHVLDRDAISNSPRHQFTNSPIASVSSLASPMPASWNQVASWLKRIDALRNAA